MPSHVHCLGQELQVGLLRARPRWQPHRSGTWRPSVQGFTAVRHDPVMACLGVEFGIRVVTLSAFSSIIKPQN